MSKNFEWRSDEDEGWEGDVATLTTAVAPRRRRYGLLLLLLLLVAGGGVLLARGFNQRLVSATSAIETEVLAVHNLLRDAAHRQDLELFITGLSGRSPDWVDAQQRLVQEGAFLARPAFGLAQAGGSLRPITAAELTVSPDLLTAELTYEEQYTAADDQPVTLRQTAVYRSGRTNWLLTPPDAEFWGEMVTITGTHLIARFPARDTAVIERLLPDLDAHVGELCRTPDLACPDGLALTVQFAVNPALLAVLQDERVLWQQDVTWRQLPTPTLVGLPMDETGYALLRRTYANWVLTAVVTEIVDYRCCQGQLYYRALLDKLLSDVGARDWPLTDADYALLLAEDVALDAALVEVRRLWEAPLPTALQQDAWSQAHALVAFALTTGLASPLELTPGEEVEKWAGPFTVRNAHLVASILPPSGLWLQFVYRQAVTSFPAPPIPLPTQQVTLVCLGAVYSYDLTQQMVGVLEDGFTVEQMTPLADDSGLLLQGRSGSGTQEKWQAVLWRGGQRYVLYERPYQLDGKIYTAHLQGERVVLYTQELGNDFWTGLAASYFDINDCAVGECVERPLPGITRWSPDGQRTLVWQPGADDTSFDRFAATVWLGDAQGNPQVEVGTDRSFTVQWIDDVRFLMQYTSVDNPFVPELWLGQVDMVTPQRLLTMEELVAVLPAEAQAALARMTVVPIPGQPALLWLTLRGYDAAHTYYVMLNWQTGELTFHEQPMPQIVLVDFAFSPDGVWAAQQTLTNLTDSTAVSGSMVNLYHVPRQEGWQVANGRMPLLLNRSGQLVDWSLDGRWLVAAAENSLRLIAPDERYDQYVVTGYPGCTAVAWVNP